MNLLNNFELIKIYRKSIFLLTQLTPQIYRKSIEIQVLVNLSR